MYGGNARSYPARRYATYEAADDVGAVAPPRVSVQSVVDIDDAGNQFVRHVHGAETVVSAVLLVDAHGKVAALASNVRTDDKSPPVVTGLAAAQDAGISRL